MMREIDAAAHLGRWRHRTVESLAFALSLLACAVAAPSPWGGLLALPGSVAALILAGTPPRVWTRAAVVPLGFLVVGTVPLCLSASWDGIRPILSWSPEGARVAASTAVRALGSLSAMLVLAFTVPVPRLCAALRALRLPGPLVELVELVYRSIFLLDESFASVRRAMELREGFRTPAAARRSLASLAAALLTRSLERGLRQQRALDCRLAGGDLGVLEPSLSPDPFRLALALAVPAALVLAAFLLDRCHGL